MCGIYPAVKSKEGYVPLYRRVPLPTVLVMRDAGSPASDLLRYQLRGSSGSIYKLTVEGRAEAFRVFCSCPAGRKGGAFCKHAAALVLGDIDNLVQPSGEPAFVCERAVGSPLLAKALIFSPSTRPVPGREYASLDAVLDAHKSEFEGLGFVVVREASEKADKLLLFRRFKNGNLRKYPEHVLAYETEITEFLATPEGEVVLIRERVRKWSAGSRSYNTLTAAMPHFLMLVRGR